VLTLWSILHIFLRAEKPQWNRFSKPQPNPRRMLFLAAIELDIEPFQKLIILCYIESAWIMRTLPENILSFLEPLIDQVRVLTLFL
jgi:hypothetical protein